MIYTVTLNPSIDYVVHIDKLVNGITNRTTGEEYYFGGKGINVSHVLAELDLDSTALGFVAGFTGEAIEKGTRHPRITTDFIHLKEGISRINVKIKSEEETEINGQGPHIGDEALAAFMDKTDGIRDGDTLILSGSIPKTMPDDVYERILERVKDRSIRIVVDATKKLLVNSLKYRPFLIKPNRQEISEIFGAEVKDEQTTLFYARKLQEMGAKNVLVSLGGDGAMLLDETGAVHKEGVIKGKVLNTVGSGDSMVAGFVAGCIKNNDYAYALRLGSACGNATAFLDGLATREKIDELMKQFELKSN
ncbi:MAG: 1-phosphofructokinase [Clostridia bacterium]|nr:1-phosphofructokinase [Clostridia bacterium]MBQ2110342.1 1-phosphofructokinase [Clostridia bacterium]MBQ2191061.1 1-phosphofructokinase [Clostridia bacterium]MBQ5489001.1 1-phosphofructokinase [Clostridia bacterium]